MVNQPLFRQFAGRKIQGMLPQCIYFIGRQNIEPAKPRWFCDIVYESMIVEGSNLQVFIGDDLTATLLYLNALQCNINALVSGQVWDGKYLDAGVKDK